MFLWLFCFFFVRKFCGLRGKCRLCLKELQQRRQEAVFGAEVNIGDRQVFVCQFEPILKVHSKSLSISFLFLVFSSPLCSSLLFSSSLLDTHLDNCSLLFVLPGFQPRDLRQLQNTDLANKTRTASIHSEKQNQRNKDTERTTKNVCFTIRKIPPCAGDVARAAKNRSFAALRKLFASPIPKQTSQLPNLVYVLFVSLT